MPSVAAPGRVVLLAVAIVLSLVLPASASAASVRADLGSVKRIDRVAVSGKSLRGVAIQVSVRGRHFATISRARRGQRKRAGARFAPRRVRFVRLVGIRRLTRLRIRVSVVGDRGGRKNQPPKSVDPVPDPAPAPAPAPEPAPVDPGVIEGPIPPNGPSYRAGILPAPLPQSTGTQRFVSTSGSDSAAGTEAQPWRSIQKALESAQPGELVLVRGGVYSGAAGAGPDRGDGQGPSVYASPKGQPGAPITIRPYPGELAVIKGFVSLPSAQWFRMTGFVIDGADAPARAEGVSLGNTNGATPSHVELSYNEIKNFGSADSHAHGILHFSGNDTALIGNRIHNVGRLTFFDHGIYLKEGNRVVVANNLIWDVTGGYGLHIWGDLDDSWVVNNTVYGSAASGFTIGGNSDRGYPDRVVTANNIFAAHRGTADSHQGYAAKEYQPGNANSVRHNMGWANARSGAFALSLSGPSDNVTADPRFVDPARKDFRLATGSPAVNSAEAFGLLLDASGNSRGTNPDKGALEQVAAGAARVRRTQARLANTSCVLVRRTRSGARAKRRVIRLKSRCRVVLRQR